MGLAGNGTTCDLEAAHAYFLAVDGARLCRAVNGRDSASPFNSGSVMLSISGQIPCLKTSVKGG